MTVSQKRVMEDKICTIYAAGEKPLRLLNQIEAEEQEIGELQQKIKDLQ